MGPGHKLPERLGRYVVLDRLGAGTMGVVYVAYDPTLDRKVAVKVLHGRLRGKGSEQARLRLVREARSMAKLSHPNVVQVYDAGLVEGANGEEVFLAMELVEGRDLGAWQAERREQVEPEVYVQEVLQAFAQAARGLAAAHDKNLVHRDFKPSNVLITGLGVVKVTDFGLARAPTEGPGEGQGTPAPALSEAPEPDLTATGDMLGTPAYMAPEQHAGQGVGPASDQFSYCLALYEALYGRPAFEGDSWAARALAVSEGRYVPPPADRAVPSGVAGLLLQGLARDPADRFSNMHALGAALAHATAPPVTKWGPRLVALAVVVAAAGAALFTRDDPCDGAGDRIEQVWGDAAQDRVEAAWAQTGLPYAMRTHEQVAEQLDGYAEGWRQARRDACEATKVERVQSEPLMDRRIACLETRRAELSAFVLELSRPDAALVRGALDATESLPGFEACADVQRLGAGDRAPPGLALIELRARLAAARGQARAGRYEASMRSVVTASTAWGGRRDLVGRSELALTRGRLEAAMAKPQAAARWLRQAFLLAQQARHQPVASSAAAAQVLVVGVGLARHEAGLLWADIAEATLLQLGPRPAALASLAGQRAQVLSAQGDRAAAVASAREAVRLLEQVEGAAHEVARAQVALSSTLIDIRDYRRARPLLVAAVAALEGRLGPEHPALVEPLTLLARAQQGVLQLEAAEASVARAVLLARNHLGPEHAKLGEALVRKGTLHTRQNQHAPAIAAYVEAIGILTRAYGPEHTLVGRAWLNLGVTYHRMGKLDRAAEHYARVLAIREARLGPEHPDLALILQNLGSMKVEAGQPRAAVDGLRRALRIRTQHLASKVAVADVRFWLGRALYESGEDRAEGLALVRAAHATFVGEGADPQKHTRAWLQARGK